MNHDDPTPDATWQRLADADLCGEPLAPHQREFLAAHSASDPAVRVEQRLRRALAEPFDAPDDPAADERLIAGAVARFLAESGPPVATVVPLAPRRRGVWLGVGGLLLAAGLAALWSFRPAPPSRQDPLTILSGEPRLGESAAAPGDSLVDDAELRTAGAPACVGAPGRVRACLGPHSRARLADDGALWLLEGDATVEVDLPVTRFVLQVAGVRMTSEDGAFAVTVSSRSWSASVQRGSVELRDADGPLARLGAGDRLSRGEPEPAPAAPVAPPPVPEDISPVPADIPALTPSTPVPSDSPSIRPGKRDVPPAAELLTQAREHRAAGRTRDAVKAYQRLVAAHPDSPLAGTAQLALGQLQLAGDPAAALRAFDAYLERGGPLAEEAAHARISALVRLGRDAEARSATERFLARYPASSYADALRRQTRP